MSASLQVSDLHAGYGQVSVLTGVSLEVNPGEIVAVVGANGAGKTTLLGAITGLVPAARGTVRFDGADITGKPAHALPGKGLAMVPEGGRLFPFMTVEENLQLGSFSHRNAVARRLDEMMELFPILRDRRDQLAGHLSGGERQMCAIARSVMSRPKLLMLDEPSVGLSPMMVGRVFELVQELAGREGLTIVLVEQNVAEALEVSQRAYVLDHGRIVRGGASADLRNDTAIQETYMGL